MNMPCSLLTDIEIDRFIPEGEDASFGTLATPRGHLPLRDMDIQVKLEGLLGQVELCQTFVNSFDEPLEATYIFPLPDRAAVYRFRMEVAGRVVEGELQERGAARRTYEQALRDGHRAALAEEDRPNVFTLRVGNILPGEHARVRLSLSLPLPYDAGEVTFRFPLVVAPRYIPGRPLDGRAVGDGVSPDTDAVPDASRITPPVLLPGYPNPVRLGLSVDLVAGHFRPRNFRSSLHSVMIERDGEGTMHLALQPGERLNRDFVLRYDLGANAVQTGLSLVPDGDGAPEGTFVLTLLPPAPAATAARPRDVIFVLDRSGSMAGWKLVAARRALASMLDTLTEADRFTVFAFDDRVETPPHVGRGLMPATPRNRFRAVQFLQGIESRGGTEMAEPLDRAVNALTGTRDRVLVLLTDGQVGNEDQILHLLAHRLNGIRIFTLGIDQAVNEGFLRRLAALGGGSCDVVESEARLNEVMYKVHRRIGAPLLTDVRIDFAGVEVNASALVPREKADLFAGVPLTISGRYHNTSPTRERGTVEIRATDDAGRPWSQRVTGQASCHPAAAVLWARSRVRDLEDQYVTGSGNPAALEKKIIDTSLRFGVLCRFTAYVAVDRSEAVNPGGQQHQIVQPVESPAGWDMMEREELGVRCLSAPMGAMPYMAMDDADAEHELSLDARSVDWDTDTGDFQCLHEEALPRRMPAGKARARKMRKEAPALKQGDSGGLLRKLGALFRGPQKEKADRAPGGEGASDLTAYRQRARELLDQLRRAGTSSDDRLRALGVLAVKLGELLEDMATIAATLAALEPLRELLEQLQELVAATDAKPATVNRLWGEAEKMLETFVAGT